jgi:hypothetical protein
MRCAFATPEEKKPHTYTPAEASSRNRPKAACIPGCLLCLLCPVSGIQDIHRLRKSCSPRTECTSDTQKATTPLAHWLQLLLPESALGGPGSPRRSPTLFAPPPSMLCPIPRACARLPLLLGRKAAQRGPAPLGAWPSVSPRGPVLVHRCWLPARRAQGLMSSRGCGEGGAGRGRRSQWHEHHLQPPAAMQPPAAACVTALIWLHTGTAVARPPAARRQQRQQHRQQQQGAASTRSGSGSSSASSAIIINKHNQRRQRARAPFRA